MRVSEKELWISVYLLTLLLYNYFSLQVKYWEDAEVVLAL